MIVLDSSALVALLLREPGHGTVAGRLAEACVSAVNISEVLARMSREGIAPRALLSRLAALGPSIVAFDQAQAVLASEMREQARSHGIGLADCCCLALAQLRNVPVMTADRAWKELNLSVEIVLIRG